MEVAMQSHSTITYLKRAAATALLFGIVGCGTEIISYNREFRTHGIDQYNNNDYPNAASSFANALRQEPGDYISRYFLGVCEDHMGKLQQAIQEYRTTLDMMSNSMEGKGDVKFRARVVNAYADAIGRESDRTGDLAFLEHQPPSAETCFILAKIYRQAGDADNAISRFQQAQQLDPKSADVAKEYALYLEQLGQTQRAEAQLRRAYSLNSNDDEINAALRRFGIIPGPSLKGEAGLEQPVIPLGPLPEVDISTSSKQPSQQPNAAPGANTPTGAIGSTGSGAPHD
jgi:tetratricopeptide (TPR) repeat protein